MNYNSNIQKMIYDRSPYFVKNVISSLYGFLQKRKRCGIYYQHYMKVLEESQWFDNKKLNELQFEKTKEFLIFAFNNSKYYNDLFTKIKFDPEKMTSLADIRRIPVLKKDDARKYMEDIFPSHVADLNPISTHTSGTTGLGLKLLESTECFQREFAFRIQSYSWGGVTYGNRWAWCAGHPVTYHDAHKPPFWVNDYVNNWLLMSSYHLSEENLPYYIKKLVKYKPELLAGYPSSIYLLALANEELGNILQVKAVVTSSETLFDYQRAKIEKSFGCKVYSYYGNTERAAVFAECAEGSYHLRAEHSYVELLDEKDRQVEDGKIGRVICTGFGNYATPLIRYEIGDEAIFSGETVCKCGRRGIIVKKIVGRMEDYILTPDGRYVGRLDHLFKDSVNVKMAQIVQEEISSIKIKIVKKADYIKKDENEIRKEAQKRLGSEINISFEYVSDIPRTKSGKFRFIQSTLKKSEIYSKSLEKE